MLINTGSDGKQELIFKSSPEKQRNYMAEPYCLSLRVFSFLNIYGNIRFPPISKER